MGAGSDAAWSVLSVAAAVIALCYLAVIGERMEQQRQDEQERLARAEQAELELVALEAERERKREEREEVARRCAEMANEYREHVARVARELEANRERCERLVEQLLWQQLQRSSSQSREEHVRLIQDMQKHATSKERLYKWLSQHAQKDSSHGFPSILDKKQLWLYYHPDKQAGTSPEWQILCLEVFKALQALW